MLAASCAANADDRSAVLLADLSCLPLSVFEGKPGCRPDQLEGLREGMHVTSVTIGEWSALEALAADGATFFPEAD